MSQLIELSWQTQAVLVGGYIAYVIAYAGRRAMHKTLDTILIILCFGAIGSVTLGIVYNWIPHENPYRKELSATVAVLISIFGGIVWRSFVRDFSVWVLKFLSGSEDDGLHTAWETITQTQSFSYSQINVLKKDGTTLECYLMGDLNKLPNGPCILGGDGSLAMYVTHITDNDGKRREAKNLVDEDGARITFIPASEIAEVDFRRKSKKKN